MVIQRIARGRFWHAVLGAGAVLFATGAHGDGCGGGGETEPQPPPWEACPPGSHLELVCGPGCDDHGPYEGEALPYNPDDPRQSPDSCVEMCVPDSICPEGTYEETICEGWADEGLCFDPQGCPHPEPPPETCYTTCVPIGPCGPGETEAWVCEEVADPAMCFDPEGCPPPREQCYPVCIPSDDCGPDGEPVELCDDWGCWQECGPYGGDPPPEPLPEPAE